MIIEVEKLIGQTIRVKKDLRLGLQWRPLEDAMYVESVLLDVTVTAWKDYVTVNGSFATTLLVTCDRSLKRFKYFVDGTIDLEFRQSSELNEKSEVELKDDDLNISFHQGFIDLADVANQAVTLALPMKMLSPEQGDEFSASFGKEDKEDDVDERFAILKQIKERMNKKGSN